jgi:peptidoglycan/xylan/chitin deacetylase (PgdA/CDA1 family)
MYHHVLRDYKRWGKYTISPKEFENDVKYLKKAGYTTIVMQDLIDYVYKGKELPEKPIMLTFDDGHYSNYTYVLPVLKKYECRAVISVVGEYIDKSTAEGELNPAYSYFSWDVLNELVNSPYVEIQNHSYGMHEICERRGCTIKKGETYDEYTKEMLNDVGKLQNLIEEKTGYRPTAFTYPFGFVCDECDQTLKDMGFFASLSCFKGVNILSGSKEELFELKRFNRPSGVNIAEFFKQFEK